MDLYVSQACHLTQALMDISPYQPLLVLVGLTFKHSFLIIFSHEKAIDGDALYCDVCYEINTSATERSPSSMK